VSRVVDNWAPTTIPINEKFCRKKYFGRDEDPIGCTWVSGTDPGKTPTDTEVIGVVKDFK